MYMEWISDTALFCFIFRKKIICMKSLSKVCNWHSNCALLETNHRCVDSIVCIGDVYCLNSALLSNCGSSRTRRKKYLILNYLINVDRVTKTPPFVTLFTLLVDYKERNKCKLVLCSDVIASFIISSFLLRPQKSIQQKTSNCQTRSPGSENKE